MSENAFWYGYLEAGAKSSPVLRDRRLITGNPKTIYLYNHKRGTILEYSRDIVEVKLRELEPRDSIIDEMTAAYTEARNKFRPRGAKVANLPERGGASKPPRREADDDADDYQEFGNKGEDVVEDVDWESEEES